MGIQLLVMLGVLVVLVLGRVVEHVLHRLVEHARGMYPTLLVGGLRDVRWWLALHGHVERKPLEEALDDEVGVVLVDQRCFRLSVDEGLVLSILLDLYHIFLQLLLDLDGFHQRFLIDVEITAKLSSWGFALGFQSIFVAIEDLQQCQMIALSVHNLLALLQNFIFVLMGIVKYIFDWKHSYDGANMEPNVPIFRLQGGHKKLGVRRLCRQDGHLLTQLCESGSLRIDGTEFD